MNAADVVRAVDKYLPMAEKLLDDIGRATRDTVGITRHGYGPTEQVANEHFRQAGLALGLEVTDDAAGNLYMTLPGNDRARKVVLGSHTDSVPTGGNYDGAAGIAGGLVAAAALRDAGFRPRHDLTVMAIRCEESPWFGMAFVGSRLALGMMPPSDVDKLRRSDSGRTLAEHMAEIGLDPDRLRRQTGPALDPKRVKGYLELHIEQGPLLIGRGVPLGVATAIRGYQRWPEARCLGRYDHASAVPRGFRSDALLAAVELIREIDRFWETKDDADRDEGAVFTVGKFATDPIQSTSSKVPGEVSFTLNFGSTRQATMDELKDLVLRLAPEIGTKRRVKFDLGREARNRPTTMDANLRRHVADSAKELGIPAIDMATVGHDASMFTQAGVASSVLLIRNDKGSHNPDEEMEMADFALGTQVLALAATRAM